MVATNSSEEELQRVLFQITVDTKGRLAWNIDESLTPLMLLALAQSLELGRVDIMNFLRGAIDDDE